MTTHKEALTLALEALESCDKGDWSTGHVIYPSYDEDAVLKAITAIKEALAQPKQEPIGEVVTAGVIRWKDKYPSLGTKLYTTPPQRTLVGLTEEEIEACFHYVDEAGIGLFDFAEAIEAKLKENNT